MATRVARHSAAAPRRLLPRRRRCGRGPQRPFVVSRGEHFHRAAVRHPGSVAACWKAPPSKGRRRDSKEVHRGDARGGLGRAQAVAARRMRADVREGPQSPLRRLRRFRRLRPLRPLRPLHPLRRHPPRLRLRHPPGPLPPCSRTDRQGGARARSPRCRTRTPGRASAPRLRGGLPGGEAQTSHAQRMPALTQVPRARLADEPDRQIEHRGRDTLVGRDRADRARDKALEAS